MIDTSKIDPAALYTAAEACKMIPSAFTDDGISLNTFHAWRKAGTIKPHQMGGRWYVHGHELLRLLGVPESGATVQTPAERKEAATAAMQQLRDRGIKV